MTIQKTFERRSVVAYPGLIADIDSTNRAGSAAAEGAILFGAGVFRGTDTEKQCKTSGTLFRGVAVRDQAVAGSENGQYNDKTAVSILEAGAIWVELATTGGPGDALTVELATGEIGTTAVGAGFVAINGVLETTVAVAGDLARIRLNGGK